MIQITKNWYEILKPEFDKEYFKKLQAWLNDEYSTHTIFPPYNQIFNALNLVKYRDVKVVIIGQDPYHEIGQAMGMSFSVPNGVALPPSLKNIYKEIEDEFKASYIKWIKSQNIVIPQQDSVKSVINTKGLSNIELFEMLVKNYLYDFNNYLENFLKLIKELKNNIVFPLKYLVYEKDNKNYIALTDISEYESSKEICKKFNLFAIAKE